VIEVHHCLKPELMKQLIEMQDTVQSSIMGLWSLIRAIHTQGDAPLMGGGVSGNESGISNDTVLPGNAKFRTIEIEVFEIHD
jgi:hypothetical protein